MALMAAASDIAANAAFTVAASAGQTYSFQGLVSADLPLDGAAIRLWNESDGASLVSPLVVSDAWQWIRIEGHSVTANEPLLCQVYPNLSGTTGTIRIAGAQLEAKPYSTAYCDGDMGEGFAWTGTPHASPSTRAAGRLQAPLARIDPLYGALAAWVRPDWPGGDGREHVVLHAAANGTELRLSHAAAGSWRAAWTAPTGTDAAEVTATHDRDQPLLLVMQWTPARLELHLLTPGGAEVSATATRAVRPAAIPQGTLADLGRRTDAAEGYANAQLGPIAGFSGPLDASARRTLVRLDRPWRWGDSY